MLDELRTALAKLEEVDEALELFQKLIYIQIDDDPWQVWGYQGTPFYTSVDDYLSKARQLIVMELKQREMAKFAQAKTIEETA